MFKVVNTATGETLTTTEWAGVARGVAAMWNNINPAVQYEVVEEVAA